MEAHHLTPMAPFPVHLRRAERYLRAVLEAVEALKAVADAAAPDLRVVIYRAGMVASVAHQAMASIAEAGAATDDPNVRSMLVAASDVVVRCALAAQDLTHGLLSRSPPALN